VDVLSLDTLIARLRRLQIEGGLSVESEHGTDLYEVMLFPAAAEGDIAAAQAQIGKHLPADFLRFWRFSNGANLFLNESGLHGVGVSSTGLMMELQEEEAEFYGRDALRPYAVFARVNGAGDFLVFDLDTGRILDGVHAEQPREWRAIADSFTHWLASFLDAGGAYYWIEALYESVRRDGA
jgi:hypothetical protein